MKILFIGMGNSSHSYRWVSQLFGQQWDIHFFSSYDIPDHPQLFGDSSVTMHRSRTSRLQLMIDLLRYPIANFKTLRKKGFKALYLSLYQYQRSKLERRLESVIRVINPDVIHTMHTQTSAYLLVKIRRKWKGKFPRWIHSVWGSDLYYWGRFPEKRRELSEILSYVDCFLGEGRRDQIMATELGFRGEFLDPIPASGGFEGNVLKELSCTRPSTRKQITLKGYQDIVGRFYVGLRALEKVQHLLNGYEVNIFCMIDEGARTNAKLFEIETGIKINIIEKVPYQEMLHMHGRSRISIGLSISDGLPSSFLEAMAMGSFPIQSFTSLADEWVKDGETGLLVPPNDPEIVAQALERALTDDALVDSAADLNRAKIMADAEVAVTSAKAIKLYEKYHRLACDL